MKHVRRGYDPHEPIVIHDRQATDQAAAHQIRRVAQSHL
jgi:hypothetical protein